MRGNGEKLTEQIPRVESNFRVLRHQFKIGNLAFMRSLLLPYQRNALARNTLWMFLGEGLRLPIQAGYFIIIAHSLGPEQYGAFAAVTALVAIVAPFVGIGSDKLIV